MILNKEIYNPLYLLVRDWLEILTEDGSKDVLTPCFTLSRGRGYNVPHSVKRNF